MSGTYPLSRQAFPGHGYRDDQPRQGEAVREFDALTDEQVARLKPSAATGAPPIAQHAQWRERTLPIRPVGATGFEPATPRRSLTAGGLAYG